MKSAIVRLLAANARISLEPFLRGGWQAFGWVAGETVIAVAGITAPIFLVGRFGRVGAWSGAELMFLLGMATVSRGIALVFSGHQAIMISRKIGRGQIDHVLMQPLPLWKALLVEGFSPFDLTVSLVLGLGILFWSAARLPIGHEPLGILLIALFCLCGSGIFVAAQYLWGAAAFWYPQGAEEVNMLTYNLLTELSVYPLDFTSRVVKGILLTTLPAGFMGWLPASVLLSSQRGLWFVMPLFAIGFGLLSLAVFRRGLRKYHETGSSRYSDFGHRR